MRKQMFRRQAEQLDSDQGEFGDVLAAISEEDVDLVIQDMKLDADGLALEFEPHADLATPAEPANETVPTRQAIAASDRVVEFRNPAEKDG